MSICIRKLRSRTGKSQKEFASMFGIPVSTLRKWEQGDATPPQYVVDLIAASLPADDNSLTVIHGRSGEKYYYDRYRRELSDNEGNKIRINEDLEGVKEQNLGLYVTDLFEDFRAIKTRFEEDCRFDKQEDIIWI